MKKSIILLLVLSFIASLCGCHSKFDPQTNEKTEKSKSPIEQYNEEMDKARSLIEQYEEDNSEKESQYINHTEHWNWSNGVYSNSFVGLKFTTFDDWTQYTNEELLELQENDYASLATIIKEMYKDRIVYACYSNSTDKDSFVSLCYENKTKLENDSAKEYTLDKYVSEYKTSLNYTFKSVDIQNESETEFCGNTYKCIEASIYSDYNGGGYIRKNFYFRQVDDYYVTLTLTAGPFGNESIEDIVARFSAL